MTRKNAKYCGKTIRKINEYLFNTAEYLKQTIKFLNDLLNETDDSNFRTITRK